MSSSGKVLITSEIQYQTTLLMYSSMAPYHRLLVYLSPTENTGTTVTQQQSWMTEQLKSSIKHRWGKPLPSKELSVFRISSLFIFIELLVVPFCLANILKPNAVLRPWLCSRDYSKRRDCNGIKKALKEKGIRLQTLIRESTVTTESEPTATHTKQRWN